MNKTISVMAILLLVPLVIFAQLNISGELTPSAMFRLSDGSQIDLPFRPGNLSVDYAWGDFEFNTNTAIETRWENAEFNSDMLQFREAYLSWYPSFGEIKLGKMIHAWGAADGNNPTDNLSPYDFYYMFLTGTDRKIGTISASSLVYFSDFQFELVVLPKFVENRIPYDEPDFPIKIELPPNIEITEPEETIETGAKVKYAMGLGDISLSQFRGYDRSMSSIGVRIGEGTGGTAITIHPQLGYRETNMYGGDFVFFPGNWTIRGEFAYFQTKTPDINLDATLLVTEASYHQSVIQIEYAFSNGLQLMGQLISTDYGDISNTITPDLILATLPDELQHGLFQQMNSMEFQPGMGTPFALIAERLVMVSSMFETLDNTLELSGMLMVNLLETGYMASVGSRYSLVEGLNLDAGVSYFIGGDEAGNKFKNMENFSNLSLGIAYSF